MPRKKQVAVHVGDVLVARGDAFGELSPLCSKPQRLRPRRTHTADDEKSRKGRGFGRHDVRGGVARQPRVWNSAPPEGACRDEEASEAPNG